MARIRKRTWRTNSGGMVMKKATDDDAGLMMIDTGEGRWFVFEHQIDEQQCKDAFSLIAGPYQHEDVMKRFVESYEVPDGVDNVVCVRCEGAWWNVPDHIEAALADARRRFAHQEEDE